MKKCLLLLWFTVSIYTQSQIISGTVFSKEDKTAIPYVKIGVLNGDFGVQTDENGKFQFDLDKVTIDKELIIVVPGYEEFRSSVADFVKNKPHDIYLKDKVTDIQEVVIVPKNFKDKNLGVNSRSKSIMFTPNMEKGESVVVETAVEFNSSKKVKVTKINMNFSRFESTVPIKVRYTIYDEKDGKPNDLIIGKDIIATISKDQLNDSTFSIDVSNDKIWLQGKFFVGIQFIGQTDGKVALSGALFRTGYYRSFYGNWEKIGMAAPAINIDVKVKK